MTPFEFYLGKLRAGDFDAAFHGLIELDPPVLRELMAAFSQFLRHFSPPERGVRGGNFFQARKSYSQPFHFGNG
jgi:hypothetical protein